MPYFFANVNLYTSIEAEDAYYYNNINNKKDTDDKIRGIIDYQEIISFNIEKRKQYIKIADGSFNIIYIYMNFNKSVYYKSKNKSKECKAISQLSRLFMTIN